jgi:hypothetical protein
MSTTADAVDVALRVADQLASGKSLSSQDVRAFIRAVSDSGMPLDEVALLTKRLQRDVVLDETSVKRALELGERRTRGEVLGHTELRWLRDELELVGVHEELLSALEEKADQLRQGRTQTTSGV